ARLRAGPIENVAERRLGIVWVATVKLGRGNMPAVDALLNAGLDVVAVDGLGKSVQLRLDWLDAFEHARGDFGNHGFAHFGWLHFLFLALHFLFLALLFFRFGELGGLLTLFLILFSLVLGEAELHPLAEFLAPVFQVA